MLLDELEIRHDELCKRVVAAQVEEVMDGKPDGTYSLDLIRQLDDVGYRIYQHMMKPYDHLR